MLPPGAAHPNNWSLFFKSCGHVRYHQASACIAPPVAHRIKCGVPVATGWGGQEGRPGILGRCDIHESSLTSI